MQLFNDQSLIGKKFLITGASSGIGRAAAVQLAACGAEVILCGRNLDRLESSREILLNPKNHHVQYLNLVDVEQISNDLQKIADIYGVLDGVFHSAGNSLLKPAKLVNNQDVQNILGPSLYAALAIAKVFSKKSYLKDVGSIVFMSSVAGTVGQQGMSLYSASKAGIDGVIRSLACELSARKIRVNGIVAGGVKTEMHERMLSSSNEAAIDAYEKMHPLGFGMPEDIAGLVAYLMSDISKWITGSLIHIDGGYTAR
jgi:NAD(P)-dependent dehydrogenase (short-subunit alcohol dehydrogenase family)